ncbi:hypothetical protein NUSPORA_01155 [Nucleospora cyclopteri]
MLNDYFNGFNGIIAYLRLDCDHSLKIMDSRNNLYGIEIIILLVNVFLICIIGSIFPTLSGIFLIFLTLNNFFKVGIILKSKIYEKINKPYLEYLRKSFIKLISTKVGLLILSIAFGLIYLNLIQFSYCLLIAGLIIHTFILYLGDQYLSFNHMFIILLGIIIPLFILLYLRKDVETLLICFVISFYSTYLFTWILTLNLCFFKSYKFQLKLTESLYNLQFQNKEVVFYIFLSALFGLVQISIKYKKFYKQANNENILFNKSREHFPVYKPLNAEPDNKNIFENSVTGKINNYMEHTLQQLNKPVLFESDSNMKQKTVDMEICTEIINEYFVQNDLKMPMIEEIIKIYNETERNEKVNNDLSSDKNLIDEIIKKQKETNF